MSVYSAFKVVGNNAPVISKSTFWKAIKKEGLCNGEIWKPLPGPDQGQYTHEESYW